MDKSHGACNRCAQSYRQCSFINYPQLGEFNGSFDRAASEQADNEWNRSWTSRTTDDSGYYSLGPEIVKLTDNDSKPTLDKPIDLALIIAPSLKAETAPAVDSDRHHALSMPSGWSISFEGLFEDEKDSDSAEARRQMDNLDFAFEDLLGDDLIESERSGRTEESSIAGKEEPSEISESSESDGSQGSVLEQHAHSAVLHSKHELLARLMQEVYAIFDQRWRGMFNSHAGDTSTSVPLHSSTSQSRRGGKSQKRHRDDRDTTPPEDRSKRRRQNDKPSPTPADNRMLACPFRKHDSNRYCCNSRNGLKYRACVGPGFESISRLK